MLYYHKVWGVLLIGWMSLYMVRMGMSPLLVPIMDEFNLSYARAGLLSSAIFWAYTCMQIPSGYMGDRWGRKRFLILGTLCWSILCFFTGFVNSFVLLFVIRFLTGMAQGTFFGNDRPIIAAYTPLEKMGRGQGISAMGMGLGMGFGILLAGQIAESWGWRSVFFLYSIPSFVAFLFILKIIRDPEPALGKAVRLEKTHFSMAFKSGDLWMLYLACFSVMYMLWLLGTWSPAIFLELGVGSIASAGVYAAVLGFIGVPALLISGAISDRMKKKGQNRKYHLMVCLLIMSVLAFLMGLGLDLGFGSAWFIVLIILGGFATWSYFPPYYALLPDLVPEKILGTTYGAANTVNFMASLVAPWCTGYLRDQTQGFSWGFYITSVVVFAGLLCLVVSLRLTGGAKETIG